MSFVFKPSLPPTVYTARGTVLDDMPAATRAQLDAKEEGNRVNGAKTPGWFNGRTLITDMKTLSVTDYSYSRAASTTPGLHIYSLGVVGMLVCPDGLIVAKRSMTVGIKPGVYHTTVGETAEQGDEADGWREGIYRAFREETGLASEDYTIEKTGMILPLQCSGGECLVAAKATTVLSFREVIQRWEHCDGKDEQTLHLLPPRVPYTVLSPHWSNEQWIHVLFEGLQLNQYMPMSVA